VNGARNKARMLRNISEEVLQKGVYMGMGPTLPPHLYLLLWGFVICEIGRW
jgi:hypothetical protein